VVALDDQEAHAARGEPGTELANVGGRARAGAGRLDEVARHNQVCEYRAVEHE